MTELIRTDPLVANLINLEKVRQENHLELIASENYTSKAVREAVGSCLTNKYAEGYPGARYYGGCEHVDSIERLAIDRATELFGAEHVNVQPHSGTQANMAVYNALLEPGDVILSMNLSHGGHLSHGSKVSMSGKYFKAVHYGVNAGGYIDYNEIDWLAKKWKPKLIIAGASAYPRVINFRMIRDIARKYDAYFMVDMAHIAGLVAAGLHDDPMFYADVVTATTHKTLRGPRGGLIMCKNEFAKKIDKSVFPGNQGGPLMHVIAGKAVCFGEALRPDFADYQEQVVRNSQALAKSLMDNGITLSTGGTDNHLILAYTIDYGKTGNDVEKLLDSINITINKNMMPHDALSPKETSGIRIGTPALTTRGFKEDEMKRIGEIIADVIKSGSQSDHYDYREEVLCLCQKHPIM